MVNVLHIMLVEDDPQICSDFEVEIAKRKTMVLKYQTDCEQNAYNYLEVHDIDVLILDIELTEGDGLSLLERMKESEQTKPFVIVVTNTVSNATLNCMRSYGADYIYQKRNQSYSASRVLGIVEKVYRYHNSDLQRQIEKRLDVYNREKADHILKMNISAELMRMGFKRRLVGFTYIVDAIYFIVKSKRPDMHVTSEVYPILSEMHEVTLDAVECGIRNSIESAFVGARVDVLIRHYPFYYDESKGKPSNTDFIVNMASRFKL